MNVSLTPQLEQAIQDRVQSGRYSTASEVVRDALRLLETRDRARDELLGQLQSDVAAGLEALDSGNVIAGDRAFEMVLGERSERVGHP